MRWQHLFADLAAQFEAAEAAATAGELASRTRAEVGAVRLVDRVGGSLGSTLTLRCRGAGVVAGVATEVGPDWLLLTDDRGREVLVATAAVLALHGLGRSTAPRDDGVVAGRLDLRWALRAVARDRSGVQLVLADGGVLTGTIDRVGADFVELSEHPAEEPRRPESVRRVWAVPLAVVAVVRTLTPAPD
jgi:hypothetical protein